MPRQSAPRLTALGARPGWTPTLLAALLGLAPLAAVAQTAPAGAAPASTAAEPPPQPSALDAPMFYQLMVAEFEANSGRLGNAYEVMLDAARRVNDPVVFERAIELAVQARSGDQALLAARAWRQAQPRSVAAVRAQVQMLAATDRVGELGEPLRTLLQLTEPSQRSATISSLPRFLEGTKDRAQMLQTAEQALSPFMDAPDTRTAARVSLGRVAMTAGQGERAFALARKAQADDPAAMGPLLLAVELMPTVPAAETLVQAGLAQPGQPPAVRLAYARSLEQRQRLVEAVQHTRQALAEQGELPQGWLSLGAMLLDLHRPAEADEALQRALRELDTSPPAEAVPHGEATERLRDMTVQLLAQAAAMRGEFGVALDWLARIPPDRLTLSALTRQAEIVAQQGRVDEARRRVREAPVSDDADTRARLLAELQVLRAAQRWTEAHALLQLARQADPDDTTLMYEQAMSAERLNRFDEMEALLRRLAALKPDDAQPYNALGYSLAERNIRLAEAGELLRKALKLAPGDPYITDSMGWFEYRSGRLDEAERLLRQAWTTRPHPDVAAHLGEVLWVQGRRDEALAVFREGLAGGRSADAVRATMARLKAPAQ
ncbi:tetratricopeptide repeat protein [Ideonella sp. 4Y11]|uniref:Tetratricopeptide repeat protein n=1 Tax=Ideonella aquatica TaxID=2824119 RepID=A0A940YLH0_9BURK|nr:tetratricopeptide repeat protein [Ideonella aquatica]MBQ0958148.1 tetratricopeptide repeat protein [Ideonella aquatica]